MRVAWGALLLSLVGLGCGDDDKGGPNVGPDTSWQMFCAPGSTTCPYSFNPHGPRDSNGDGKVDHEIEASCSRSASGYAITLTDPGSTEAATRRTASQLRIARVDLEANECFVQFEDRDPMSGALLRLVDSCEGNGDDGTCVIDAQEDSNGYALEGTITCSGMRNNDQGPADFMLRRGRSLTQPVVLQIARCD